MNQTSEFERLLGSVLDEDGPSTASEAFVDRVLAASRPIRQRRPLIRALDRRAWPGSTRSVPRDGTPAALRLRDGWTGLRPSESWAMLALVGIIVLALLAAVVMVGSRTPVPNLLAVDGPAPPPPEGLPGPSLVYGAQAGGLVVAESDGSNPRLLVRGGGWIQPRLSTDRRWIAASAYGTLGDSLAVLHADGSIALDLRGDNPVQTYAWGPPGPSAGWLAASIDQSIVVVDLVSGTRVTIDTGDAMVGALAWSPDAPNLWWATGRPPTGNWRDGITAADIHAIRLDATDGMLRIADQQTFALDVPQARTIRGLEQMAVSPDGRTLAFRARVEGWMRSDILVADAEGGAATFLTAAPPDAPWATAWSGIRWLPDGSGVVAEVGDRAEGAIVRPTILPVDGTSPRPIIVSPLKAEDGGVVDGTGPVLPTDTAVLVGAAGTWIDTAGGVQARVHDLWVAGGDGRASRLVARDTLGGDLR